MLNPQFTTKELSPTSEAVPYPGGPPSISRFIPNNTQPLVLGSKMIFPNLAQSLYPRLKSKISMVGVVVGFGAKEPAPM